MHCLGQMADKYFQIRDLAQLQLNLHIDLQVAVIVTTK